MMGVERPDWTDGPPPAEPETPTHLPTEFADEAAAIRQRDAEIDAEIAAEEASLPVPSGSSDLPAQLTAAWAADPAGPSFRMVEATGYAQAILNEISDADRAGVVANFDRLPDGAQTAILGEIALGSSGSVKVASDDEMASFAATDEGAELVDFWRGAAGRNVGRISTRVGRMQDAMTASERDAARAWFDALPSRGKIAVLAVLAE